MANQKVMGTALAKHCPRDAARQFTLNMEIAEDIDADVCTKTTHILTLYPTNARSQGTPTTARAA